MLQPWDICQSIQHNLIKDLTNHDPDLRNRIFGRPPPLAPLGPYVLPDSKLGYADSIGEYPRAVASILSKFIKLLRIDPTASGI